MQSGGARTGLGTAVLQHVSFTVKKTLRVCVFFFWGGGGGVSWDERMDETHLSVFHSVSSSSVARYTHFYDVLYDVHVT